MPKIMARPVAPKREDYRDEKEYNLAWRIYLDDMRFYKKTKLRTDEKLEGNSIEETFAKVLGIDISELEKLMQKADMPLGDYMELTIVLDNDGDEVDLEGLHDFVMGDPKYANIFGDYLPLVNESSEADPFPKQYWYQLGTALSKEFGNLNTKVDTGNYSREITFTNDNIYLQISHSWKHDGSPTKPVTFVEFDNDFNGEMPLGNERNLGRFAIWDNPEEYAQDIIGVLQELTEARKPKPNTPRDPNWKTNLAKRQSGAAGAHDAKKYTKKDRKAARKIDMTEKTLVGSEPNEKAKDPPNTQDQGTGVGKPGMTSKKGKSGQPGFVGGESISFEHMSESQMIRKLVDLPKHARIMFENVEQLSVSDVKRLHADLRGFTTPGKVEQEMALREMKDKILNRILSEREIKPTEEFQVAWNNAGTSDKVWGWFRQGDQAMTFWGRKGKSLRFKPLSVSEAKFKFLTKIHERGYVNVSTFNMATEIVQQAKNASALGEEMSPAEMKQHEIELDREAKRPGSDVSVNVDGHALIGDLEAIADNPEDPNSKVAVIKNKMGGETTIADLSSVSTLQEEGEFYYVWVDYGQGFEPHMTFPKDAEGRYDARAEIVDLKDHGNNAKIGEPFPPVAKPNASALETGGWIEESVGIFTHAGVPQHVLNDSSGMIFLRNHMNDVVRAFESYEEANAFAASEGDIELDRILELAEMRMNPKSQGMDMPIQDILAMDRASEEDKKAARAEEKRKAALMRSNKFAGMDGLDADLEEGESDYWECLNCGTTNENSVCSSCGSEHMD